MAIRVEFYGIARQRAGTNLLALDVPHLELSLAGVLDGIAAVLPGFAEGCLERGRLKPSLAMNLDGQRFISDPATTIRDGQSLLILSADAGG